MKEASIPTTNLINKSDENISPASAGRKWTIILYFCSIGGLLIGLSGLTLSGLSYFEFFEKANHLHKLGTWLIVVAFPLIMFGAHALDKIGELNNSSNSENK
jgi:phosphatidylglycerophosphate synthase